MEENKKAGSGRGKGILFLILIILLLLGGGIFFFRDKLPFLNSEQEVEFDKVLVLDVIDGKTIEVLYHDNEEIVSIIGIDVPVARGNVEECFLQESLDMVNEVIGGENVILETDESKDDDGRILAYIRLLNGEDYGEKLLWGGYAWNGDDHERSDVYDEAEIFAKDNELGLWNPTTCNGEKTIIEENVDQEVVMMPEELIESDDEKMLEIEIDDKEIMNSEGEDEIGYDCIKGKYSCEDFYSGTGTTAMAQDVFDFCKKQKFGDLYHLDNDKNGIACDDNEIITDSKSDEKIKNMVKLPSSGMEIVYDCSYDRYSCEDFLRSTDAQVMFEICKARGVGDIHKLDADSNGQACEYLGE